MLARSLARLSKKLLDNLLLMSFCLENEGAVKKYRTPLLDKEHALACRG